MKCAFGVSAGRFLGFKVHKGGILADEEKIQAMREMKTTSNIKELQRFLGKLGNIRRFVLALGELLGPLRPLLKEKEMFIWGVKQQVAFEKIKQVLTSTQTMIPPQKGKPLKVYLTVGEEAVSGLVAQVKWERKASCVCRQGHEKCPIEILCSGKVLPSTGLYSSEV